MDSFSASLMKDKREIIIAPTIYKFANFGEFAQEFALGERDVVLTNEFIYKPFMEQFNLPCSYVFQEKFGVGEPSEAMIETMYEQIPYETYDRVIAIGGGAIMDLCKLLGCKRPSSVHELYFKREPVVHEKEVIAIPTTCGTGSEVTNISVAIVKDEKNGVLTGGETKLGLVSDDIIPNKVCLIPDLLKTLPMKPFAASAIDALIHATESYLSPSRKTMTSEMYSVKAMELILEGFRRIGENGADARLDYLEEFVTASLYAGIAFPEGPAARPYTACPSRLAAPTMYRTASPIMPCSARSLRSTTRSSPTASWRSSRHLLAASWAATLPKRSKSLPSSKRRSCRSSRCASTASRNPISSTSRYRLWRTSSA